MSRYTLQPCALCNRPVDPDAVGTHQWTSGWVMLREGGGGHGISCPVREPRWAHRTCVETAAGGTLGQRSLFSPLRKV